MSDLEQQFHEAMIQLYKDALRECKLNGIYFLQLVTNKGGLATAQYLITTDKPSDGFTRLWELGRLDLTVEALALNPIYRDLFTEDELIQAKERLQQYGYEVP